MRIPYFSIVWRRLYRNVSTLEMHAGNGTDSVLWQCFSMHTSYYRCSLIVTLQMSTFSTVKIIAAGIVLKVSQCHVPDKMDVRHQSNESPYVYLLPWSFDILPTFYSKLIPFAEIPNKMGVPWFQALLLKIPIFCSIEELNFPFPAFV